MTHTELEKSHGSPYKGNVGNLMQHWTFCELLTIANEHATHLNFIDAHAMAPMATQRKGKCPTFDNIRKGLPNGESCYERAWRKLVPSGTGYPNSAAFLAAVWKGSFSLILCERDPSTAKRIESWAHNLSDNCVECRHTEVYCGDWRERFERGLPGDGLTLISFDPYKYDRYERKRKCADNLYPPDIEKLLCATRDANDGILIQLSTYSRAHGNNQEDVKKSIYDILVKSGSFKRAASVKANRNMMSLIYARNIDWDGQLQALEAKFEEWWKPRP